MNFKEIAAKLSKKWFHNKQLPEMAVNGNKMIIFRKCSETVFQNCLKTCPTPKLMRNMI